MSTVGRRSSIPRPLKARALSIIEEEKETRRRSSSNLPSKLPKERRRSSLRDITNNNVVGKLIASDNEKIADDSVFEVKSDDPFSLPDGLRYEDVRDCYSYVKNREKELLVDARYLTEGDARAADIRALLIDWLISVVHYFNMSQETLYHTVSLVDRTMERRYVRAEYVQLLGVASLLIASKLEEYYPADINAMIKMTQNSYSRDDILKMEKTILRLLSFKAYGPEPVTFIQRLIRVAGLEDDRLFYDTALFFYDACLVEEWYSSVEPSKLACAAVYSALRAHERSWTPRLDLHGEFGVADFEAHSIEMLQNALKIRAAKSEEGKKGPYRALYKKFSSKSRHQNVLNSDVLSTPKLERLSRRS